MNEPRIVAWIFYAVEMASASGPASERSISELADGINHAVPTSLEMRESLLWLMSAGLISKAGAAYSLTSDGVALVGEARKDASTISLVWSRLTMAIESLMRERP